MTTTTEALGPQHAALTDAADTYETLLHGHGPEALRYDAAINSADWRAVETAERHAMAALEADGIASAAVHRLGGCGWGSAAITLAARHLIGTGGWTQELYDMLARPWVAAGVGPLHPDDA